jgi:PAS domain S-box-containing protein
LDTNARITYVSPSITGLLGYTVDEMLSLSMEEYLAPVSLEVALKTFREDQTMESLGNGKRPRTRQLVMELRRKDGTAVWTETTLTFLRNPDGHITGYLGIVRDISERKQVEEALQESEAEYRLLVENSNEAITVACDGIICFANSKTTEISGYSREELISKAFVDFIHPDDREMVAERHVRRVTGEQFPGVYSFRFVDKSGNVKWLEANAVLISWEGRPASLNFSTDITERKQALDELKASYEQLRNLYRRLQSVREEERISIAREVHDELGQALVGLKMDISWLGTKLRPTNETLLDKTRAMSEAIDNTIKAVKRISTTLRPAVLDDLGLVAAVQWQVTEFQSKTGIKCKLDLGRHRELATDAELNTGIFRILQEALTNIVRHANATKVKVSLLQKDGELLLKLSDNGRGIEKDQISSPESFGLIGIRERASALGGEAKIIGIPGRGTVLTVAVPMIRGMKSHDKNIGG